MLDCTLWGSVPVNLESGHQNVYVMTFAEGTVFQ